MEKETKKMPFLRRRDFGCSQKMQNTVVNG